MEVNTTNTQEDDCQWFKLQVYSRKQLVLKLLRARVGSWKKKPAGPRCPDKRIKRHRETK